MTRRRWIANAWDEKTATLTGEQANHLGRVLRAQPGMEFDVVAGERVWRAVLASADESAAEFDLLEQIGSASALSITVLFSIVKFDRFEWAVEKLTELGVASIEPVIARRTEKHLAQAALKRVERWRRIALEAAKQSRRSSLPLLADPRPLADCLLAHAKTGTRLLLAEEEKQQTLFSSLQSSPPGQDLVLAVGSEGGWTTEEQKLFEDHAWVPVTLGSTILRAETAAIAAVSVLAAWLNG